MDGKADDILFVLEDVRGRTCVGGRAWEDVSGLCCGGAVATLTLELAVIEGGGGISEHARVVATLYRSWDCPASNFRSFLLARMYVDHTYMYLYKALDDTSINGRLG
jgi:hypothetical protein